MADLKPFNQANVNDLINKIDGMPADQRARICADIRADLRCFLSKHFSLSEGYQNMFNGFLDSTWSEFGFGVAMALEEKEWKLVVLFPPTDPTPAGKCKSTEQKVEVSYDPQTGSPSVSKSVTWTF